MAGNDTAAGYEDVTGTADRTGSTVFMVAVAITGGQDVSGIDDFWIQSARRQISRRATTTRTIPPGTGARKPAVAGWLGRQQAALSRRARAGWTITNGTGRLGFGGRTYRDPRFDARRAAMAGPDSPVPTEVRPFRGLAR
jgi:hypothetical protein